jgi:hypothetical protein
VHLFCAKVCCVSNNPFCPFLACYINKTRAKIHVLISLKTLDFCFWCRTGKQVQRPPCGPIGQKHKAKSVYCSDFQLGSQQMIVTRRWMKVLPPRPLWNAHVIGKWPETHHAITRADANWELDSVFFFFSWILLPVHDACCPCCCCPPPPPLPPPSL